MPARRAVAPSPPPRARRRPRRSASPATTTPPVLFTSLFLQRKSPEAFRPQGSALTSLGHALRPSPAEAEISKEIPPTAGNAASLGLDTYRQLRPCPNHYCTPFNTCSSRIISPHPPAVKTFLSAACDRAWLLNDLETGREALTECGLAPMLTEEALWGCSSAGEREYRKLEATGSNPVTSTIRRTGHSAPGLLMTGHAGSLHPYDVHR